MRSTSQTQIEQAPQTPQAPASRQPTRQDIALIIAAASAAAAAAKPPPAVTDVGGDSPSKEMSPSKHHKKSQTKEEKETNKEKRLLKLIGAVVVKCMSKYQKQLDHDLFKKHAKEVRFWAMFSFRTRLNNLSLS
jgi:[histone H3]-lysine36 N-trimethyltransferase